MQKKIGRLRQILALVTLSLIITIFFTGLVVSTLSAIYLSGWEGGRYARTTTTISIGVFCLFFTFYLYLQKKSQKRITLNFIIMSFIPFAGIVSSIIYYKQDLSFLLGFLTFVSILSIGKFVTKRLMPKSNEMYLAYLPLGQLVITAFYLILEKYFQLKFLSWTLLSVGIVLIVKDWPKNVLRWKEFLETNIDSFREEKFYPVILGLLGILLVAAHSPILGYDALSMKAWLPAMWVYRDSIFLPIDHLLSGVTGSFSFTLITPTTFSAEAGGNSIQFLSLVYSFVILLRYFARKNQKLTFIHKLSLISLIGIPANVWQISNSYDDLWLMANLLSALMFVQSNFEIKNVSASFHNSLVIGSVATTKFSLTPVVFVLSIILVSQILNSSLIESHKKIKICLANLIGLVVSLIPFYGWKWLTYGNPVWPLFNNIFKAPGAPKEYIRFNLPFSELSLKDFLLSPFTTLFKTSIWGEEGAPGSYLSIYSVIVISCILSVLLYAKLSEKVFSLATILFGMFWLINFRYSRYLLHIFPVALLVITSFASEHYQFIRDAKGKSRAYTEKTLLTLVGFLCAVSFTIGNPVSPERIPYKYIFSDISNSSYLETISPSYRLIEFLNEALPENSILVSPVIHERIWLRRDLTLYHLWELDSEASKQSWQVFPTDLNPYPAELRKCVDSKVFETYTINPPDCTESG